MTIVAGFKDLMTREMLERGLDVPRKYPNLIKALKAHDNNHKYFKPDLPFKDFRWW